MADRICIASDVLSAEIDPLGAELQSLTDRHSREYMSAGDPAFWGGRAPLLFPIVGRLRDDRYRLDGRAYAMPKHGFARHSTFALVDADPAQARFRLADGPATRAAYPFAFTLDATYALDEATLTMTVEIANPGDGVLPASFGFHPAFAWPLPGGGARAEHRIEFAHDEVADLRAITPDGLIAPMSKPSPVVERGIVFDDALFGDDALVWTELASRRLTYGAPGHAALDIAFPDMSMLGIWTKPGAAFLCIEPWAGHADPEKFAGDIRSKPGIFAIEPGSSRRFIMTVTVHPG